MLWGLSGDFAGLVAGAEVRGIPLVICSFGGGGGPELLNCQEFDFWLQLFIPSHTVPLTRQTHAYLKRLQHALLIFNTSQKRPAWLSCCVFNACQF